MDTVIVGGEVHTSGGQLVGFDRGQLWQDAAASRDYLSSKLAWSRLLIGPAARHRCSKTPSPSLLSRFDDLRRPLSVGDR